MKIEIWKDIPRYEGRYQVSTEGRIRSLDRRVPCKCHYAGKLFYRTVKGKILRPGRYCKAGHLSVVLGHGTAGRPVHQLVMLSFVGPPEEGMEVLHRNGDPTDYTTEPVWKTFLMCTGKEANGKNCRSMTFKQFDSDSAAKLKELSLQQCMT